MGDKGTTRPGYRNRNGQVVLRSTGLPGTDYNQTIYVLRCENCGHEYGSNGSDNHPALTTQRAEASRMR